MKYPLDHRPRRAPTGAEAGRTYRRRRALLDPDYFSPRPLGELARGAGLDPTITSRERAPGRSAGKNAAAVSRAGSFRPFVTTWLDFVPAWCKMGSMRLLAKRAAAISFGLCLSLVIGPVQAWPASVRNDVVFSSRGQALFGPNQGQAGATKTIPFGTTPVFQDQRGPVTRGQIYHLDQDIPVGTAQAIWQKAVDTCRTKLTRTQTVSVNLPVVGKGVKVVPRLRDADTERMHQRRHDSPHPQRHVLCRRRHLPELHKALHRVRYRHGLDQQAVVQRGAGHRPRADDGNDPPLRRGVHRHGAQRRRGGHRRVPWSSTGAASTSRTRPPSASRPAPTTSRRATRSR